MAKHLNENDVMGLVGTASTNYIQKISDGTTEHDLTVVNGITFFNGKADTTGVTWDGIQPLEVIIPTLADIISNPVVLKGVVNSAGDIPGTASNGDLLYIGTAGTYWGEACEAGDMAIYYNSAWHVISGENQITINANAATVSGNDNLFSITGTAKTILDVEGKTVSLKIDYDDVRSKIGVTKNNQDVVLDVESGAVTVAPMYIALSQAQGSTKDISVPVSISLPTALASGLVTISDNVLASGDFTFTSGSFPTVAKNDSALVVSASHSMNIGKEYNTNGDDGDYITNIVAIKGISFTNGTEASNVLSYVSGLVAASGKTFVSGIHVYNSATDTGDADLTIAGIPTIDAAANTFVSGLSEASTTPGDILSSITVGAVTIGEGSDVLTGLSGGTNAVVTSVSFGTAVKNTSLDWFLAGLGEESTTPGDVVTGVTIGATSLVADNSSSFAGSAVTSASVSDHVLIFSTGSFMQPVKLSKAADTINYRSFNTAGVSLSGFTQTSDVFTKGGISQATTTMSYKSLLTKAATLTDGTSVSYKFDKAEEHAYDVAREYKNISYTDATMSRNTPKLENTAISATIAANTVVVGLNNDGVLPGLTIGAPSATISGTVGTALTVSDVSWLGVDASQKEIDVVGGYTLEVVASDASGAVEVAKASTYGVASGTVTIAANTFLTDVTVNGSATPVGE